jgi:ubiquitin-protein ligase
MSMRPPNRRLKNEYDDMRELSAASSLVDFTSTGFPPTVYDVELRCTGLARVGDKIGYADLHRFRMTIGDEFPLTPPTIVWRTPVFHPNILPPKVCTGDIWYPGMALAELCVELCELVQYKSFNVYDPLDPTAAEWLIVQLAEAETERIVPVDSRPVRDPEFSIDPQARAVDRGE